MKKDMPAHGIAHRPYAYQNMLLFDNLIIQADLEVERLREDLYRKHMGDLARTFTKQPYPGYPNPSGNPRCFDTAFAMAKAYGLIYCEGLMVFDTDGGVVTMGHAWCCDRSGKVIDATSPKYQNHERVSYFGVPIRLSYAEKWHQQMGWHGLLDGYPGGGLSPVFTTEYAVWMEVIHVR